MVRRATPMTGQLTFDDCAPDWPESPDTQSSDHTPSRFDLRQDEMRDLRDQHAGPVLDAHVCTSRALTRRQREVLTHVANGNTNAQIGVLLGLHPRTIDRHLADTYKTLGARDRANAVALALMAGDLTRDDINLPADRSCT